jgi:hypothetical protein
MLKLLIVGLGLLLVASLSGCDRLATMTGGRNVEISSLPLAQQAITSLVPVFGGRRNKVIMDQVCAYVSGKKNLEEFESFFTTKGINTQELAKSDNGFRIIVTADKSVLTSACAAFMASTFFTQQNLLEGSDPKSTATQIRERLKELTPIALETVKLITEIIAEQQGQTFESLSEYKNSFQQEFERRASSYITQTLNHDFVLSDYSDDGVENGFSYTFTSGVVRLKLYDETWFGNGKLMGKRYFIYLKPVSSGIVNNPHN